ncbi:MAG TPA: GNAT family N-acetyltransferase [Marinobacter sp.]|nr:GNAT family N-acetyltransferase [Marinobacter sp.]
MSTIVLANWQWGYQCRIIEIAFPNHAEPCLMTTGEVTMPDAESWQIFQAGLIQQGERRLVLLEGERNSALRWLQAILPALAVEPGAWVGSGDQCPDSRLTTIASAHVRRWLGRELAVVVWDGWGGNPPDAFAALSGTLKAGGLLFWLMPPAVQWSLFEDPDYQRTNLNRGCEHPFAQRMANVVTADPFVIRVNTSTGIASELPVFSASQPGFSVQATDGQRVLVKQLVHFGLGRRRRPVVIAADRGRGKSAALGMAAAELLKQGRRQILVTAPFRDNADTLFRHARKELGADVSRISETVIETRTGSCLRFLSVSELLAEKPEAEVVLVDEAAAIPAPLLKQILLGWPRVAFSSTVHGYEGAGRGFAIRFRQVLDQETPHWQNLTLTDPVRWAPNDPLENLVFKMFLLAAETDAGCVNVPDLYGLVIEPWQPAEATEAELSESFGLLVNAHYRTSPSDLRQWLDDPAARSWRASAGGKLLGILWAAVEGGLSAELADQVTLGSRRIRGHLLPQSLAAHSGFPEAAHQRCLRVVRIAVADGIRQQGVGSQLVKAASGYARQHGIDTLGTSYGGTRDLLGFWRHCGLKLVRVGLQQEATSGEYPVQMLQAGSTAGIELIKRVQARLAGHWLTLAPLAWPAMDARLLAALTQSLPALDVVSEDDRRDLYSFAYGYRGFLLSLPVLRSTSMATGVIDWVQNQKGVELWCAAILQGQKWQCLQAKGLCTGQRNGEDQLRQMVRELLDNGPEL